jgi:hypothetical protein
VGSLDAPWQCGHFDRRQVGSAVTLRAVVVAGWQRLGWQWRIVAWQSGHFDGSGSGWVAVGVC